jgi:branched-chain amino acid aminotransferase
MFIASYDKDENGKGEWHDARIVPFADIPLSPAAMVFHYSQTIFEGLKAYRTVEGKIQLFRPEENARRLNVSAKRLVIPEIPEDLTLSALNALVDTDRDWVPKSNGASLYLRPFVMAVDPFVGVRPSNRYLYIIIASPSGAYYASGINPVALAVESKYVRAVKGGMGYTKTGGNYAASLASQEESHEKGYEQVLWLDGVERKYIEEVGSMNIFFVIERNGVKTLVTPELSGSILPGITRKSVIELAKSFNIPVSEERIALDYLKTAYADGTLKEVFGTGTAAVISPVGVLDFGDGKLELNNNQIGELSQKFYDTLTGIQYGRIEDTFGWTRVVK